MMAVSTELSATEITCVCFPTSGVEELPNGEPVILALVATPTQDIISSTLNLGVAFRRGAFSSNSGRFPP